MKILGEKSLSSKVIVGLKGLFTIFSGGSWPTGKRV